MSASGKDKEGPAFAIEITAAPPKKAGKSRVQFDDPASDPSASASGVGAGGSMLGKNLAPHGKGDNTFRPLRERFYQESAEHMQAKRAAAAGPSSSSSSSSSNAANSFIHINQYLACAALGLDYLAAKLTPGATTLPARNDATTVEVDDLLVAAEAPWCLAADHVMTLQELFRVVQAFIATDIRFKGKYEASCMPLQVSRVENNTLASMLDDDVCLRERPLTLSTFRQALSEDALTFDRVKILCFEPEQMAEAFAKSTLAVNASPLKPAPKGSEDEGSHGDGEEDLHAASSLSVSGVALVTEIQRSRGSVSLAQVIDGVVVRHDVMARQLYTACVARHKELRRVQGIIDIRLVGSKAATNVDVSMMVPDQDGHSNNPNSARRFSDLMNVEIRDHAADSEAPAQCVYGTSWATKSQWRSASVPYVYHDTSVLGSHITTTALAFHILNPSEFPYIPTNDLVQTAGLTLQSLGRTSCPEVNVWHGVVKYFAAQASPETTLHFLPCSGGRRGKGGLSLQQFQDLIIAVVASVSKSGGGSDKGKKAEGELESAGEDDEDDAAKCSSANDGKHPAVLLLSIDLNKARGSLNLTSADLNENIVFVIVAGISASGDQVLVIDGDTRHSETTWRISLEVLHAAIVGNGVLLLRQGMDGADLLPKGTDRKELLDAEKALHAFLPQPVSAPTAAAEARALATPIGLCCIACERIGHPTAQRSLLLHLPSNVSHLLVADPSVEDLARVFNFISMLDVKKAHDKEEKSSAKDDAGSPSSAAAALAKPRLLCRAIRLELNRVKHRKMTSTGFEQIVRNALACGSQILFHFKRSLIPNIPVYECAAAQYALAEGLLSNDVLSLQDTNPRAHHSRWTCALSDLYKACSADCCATRRPGGLLVLSSSTNAEDPLLTAIRVTRRYSPFYVPSSQAFRSPLVPQLTAVAMAASGLGYRVCPEQLLYASANSFSMQIADAVARVVSLHRRLTLSELCNVCNAYFEQQQIRLKLNVLQGSSRTGRTTKSDTLAALTSLPLLQNQRQLQRKASVVSSSAMIGVYDVRDARDVPDGFLSAGVLVGKDPIEKSRVLIVEADPTSWGAFISVEVETAADWFFKGPDDPNSALFGIAILSENEYQSKAPPRDKHLSRTKSGWSSDDDE